MPWPSWRSRLPHRRCRSSRKCRSSPSSRSGPSTRSAPSRPSRRLHRCSGVALLQASVTSGGRCSRLPCTDSPCCRSRARRRHAGEVRRRRRLRRVRAGAVPSRCRSKTRSTTSSRPAGNPTPIDGQLLLGRRDGSPVGRELLLGARELGLRLLEARSVRRLLLLGRARLGGREGLLRLGKVRLRGLEAFLGRGRIDSAITSPACTLLQPDRARSVPARRIAPRRRWRRSRSPRRSRSTAPCRRRRSASVGSRARRGAAEKAVDGVEPKMTSATAAIASAPRASPFTPELREPRFAASATFVFGVEQMVPREGQARSKATGAKNRVRPPRDRPVRLLRVR